MSAPFTPTELGLPPFVTEWRPGQFEIVQQICELFENNHTVVACIPPGEGKSFIAQAVFNLLKLLGMIQPGDMCAFLTHSKPLQDQYFKDLRTQGMVDLRGKDNYRCEKLTGLTCQSAWELCGSKEKKLASTNYGGVHCTYRRAVHRLGDHDTESVANNYAYWVRSKLPNNFPIGLVVCDEGHNAAEIVCDSLGVTINEGMWARWFGQQNPLPEIPTSREGQDNWWIGRAGDLGRLLIQHQDRFAKNPTPDVGRLITDLTQTIESIARFVGEENGGDDWIFTHNTGLNKAGKKVAQSSLKADPVWAGKYAHLLLWQGVPKRLVMSATIKEGSIGHLGLSTKQEGVAYIELPSTFDPARCPIYFYSKSPVLKNTREMSMTDLKGWVFDLDNLLRPHVNAGLKGLVQLGSYDRHEMFQQWSEFAYLTGTHKQGDSRGLGLAMEQHAKANGAHLLSSPAIGTGYDFKGDLCRVNLLGKIPFLQTKDPLVKARCKRDPLYSMRKCMELLVQMSRRGMRDGKDWCTTIIADGQGKWCLPFYGDKDRKNYDLVPDGWRVIWSDNVPGLLKIRVPVDERVA